MNNIMKASNIGQSIWCDYISRDLLDSGDLRSMVEKGVKGVTSNPSIFKKAMGEGKEYDSAMKNLASKGLSPAEIYMELAIEDVKEAASQLKGVYDSTRGLDGYVSLEVDPALAFDSASTLKEAKKLWDSLDMPNVMIKIPATGPGLKAIEDATALGISVNATLIFSLKQAEETARAYIRGLESRKSKGLGVKYVRSVASLFVSRLDSKLDPILSEKGASDLVGLGGIDNAKLVYRRFKDIFSGEKWHDLKNYGAFPQRLLLASTGTKNPAYRDTLYVEELLGPDTVDTVPPKTLEAFLDHGVPENRIERDMEGVLSRRKKIEELGIDLESITDKLLDQGLKAFQDAFRDLISVVSEKTQNH